MDHTPNPSSPGDVNRRASDRVPVQREVWVTSIEEGGGVHPGETQDISLTGLRILASRAERVGAPLQVELIENNSDDSERKIEAGKVVWARPGEAGTCEMGVALEQSVLRKPEPSLNTKKLAETLRRPRPTAPPPEAPLDPLLTAPAVPRRRTRRLFPILLGLLLVVFLIHLLAGLLDARDGTSRSSPRASTQPQAPDDPARLGVDPVGYAAALAALEEAGDTASPALLARGQYAFRHGAWAEAAASFRKLYESPSATEAERFQARFGEAEIAAAMGKKSEALELVRDLKPRPQELHPVWEELLDAFIAKLNRPGTAILPPTPFLESLELDLNGVGGGASPVVQLEVDASEFVLHVRINGAIAASYPVGLGRDGTTPKGAFQIANKIMDPDWYNRGNVVSSDDPANPLGRYWMGLGDGETASPVGIHPTKDDTSIGQPRSNGCIRMRPEDAAAVFRLAPLGTPVVIHD